MIVKNPILHYGKFVEAMDAISRSGANNYSFLAGKMQMDGTYGSRDRLDDKLTEIYISEYLEANQDRTYDDLYSELVYTIRKANNFTFTDEEAECVIAFILNFKENQFE